MQLLVHWNLAYDQARLERLLRHKVSTYQRKLSSKLKKLRTEKTSKLN